MNWKDRLVELARRQRLNEHQRFARVVEAVLVSDSERAGRAILRLLELGHYRQVLRPDHFLTMESGFEGEVLLGHMEDGRPFGLDFEDLNRHTLIVGQSGTGKSTLLRNVLLSVKKNFMSFILTGSAIWNTWPVRVCL